jgi:hypothetical protein
LAASPLLSHTVTMRTNDLIEQVTGQNRRADEGSASVRRHPTVSRDREESPCDPAVNRDRMTDSTTRDNGWIDDPPGGGGLKRPLDAR